MDNHKERRQRIINSIRELYGDTSVSRATTKASMEEIQSVCNDLIDTLSDANSEDEDEGD